MNNIAIILAGGKGTRMNAESCPKQFIEVKGKPIIIYTLEWFENHPEIDGIIVVCLESWISYLQNKVAEYGISKVFDIVPGGQTGQESIYHGLLSVEKMESRTDSLVLIHDGVRPMIDGKTISDNIRIARNQGNCITCVPAPETIIVNRNNVILDIPNRNEVLIAKAPQTFFFKDILLAHRRSIVEKKQGFIDSCTMMHYYGYELHTLAGPNNNIKITTMMDLEVFKSIIEQELDANKLIYM